MPSKPKTNAFAAAYSKKETAPPSVGEGGASTVRTEPKAKSTRAPSRVGMKQVAGYVNMAASRQLRILAAEEGRSVQDLLQEALDLLFHKYRKPTIAHQSDEDDA